MGTKNHPAPNDCYTKAEPDEPLFTLLGRDPVAAFVVEIWAMARAELAAGYEPDAKASEAAKAYEAVDCAEAMRLWALAKGKDLGAAERAVFTAFVKRAQMLHKAGRLTFAPPSDALAKRGGSL